MNLVNKMKHVLYLFFLLVGLSACGSEQPATTESDKTSVASGLEKSTAFERDTVRLDATRVEKSTIRNPRNDKWYTFDYLSEDGKEVETPPSKIDKPKLKKVSSNKDEKVEINVSKSVYMVSETDRPPLFDIVCLTEKDPEECSNTSVENFIKENIDFPDKAIAKGHDGLEMVTFIIDETGTIENKIEVLSKDTPCKNCAKAAVSVVSKMEKWTPAMRDGTPVRTRVTLPIRFEVKDR